MRQSQKDSLAMQFGKHSKIGIFAHDESLECCVIHFELIMGRNLFSLAICLAPSTLMMPQYGMYSHHGSPPALTKETETQRHLSLVSQPHAGSTITH